MILINVNAHFINLKSIVDRDRDKRMRLFLILEYVDVS